MQQWYEQQPNRLVILAKRDVGSTRVTVHIYAPADADLVAEYCRTLENLSAWQYVMVNPELPDIPATIPTTLAPHYNNRSPSHLWLGLLCAGVKAMVAALFEHAPTSYRPQYLA